MRVVYRNRSRAALLRDDGTEFSARSSKGVGLRTNNPPFRFSRRLVLRHAHIHKNLPSMMPLPAPYAEIPKLQIRRLAFQKLSRLALMRKLPLKQTGGLYLIFHPVFRDKDDPPVLNDEPAF